MEINIQGFIGDFQPDGSSDVTSSESLNAALKGLNPNEEVILKINSPGGLVFEGFNMYNTLRSLPNKVTAEISNAASIATLIALSAETVKMNEVGSFMIHRASSMASGNAEDLEKEAEVLKSIDDTLINVYSSKTGKTPAVIEELMDDTTWYTANGTDEKEGALEAGFVDEIINPVSLKAAALFTTNKNSKNMNKFKALFNSFRAEAGLEEVAAETIEEVVEPVNEITEEEAPVATIEEEEAPVAEYVTIEMFNAFVKIVEQLSEGIQENQAKSAEKAVSELKTGLKRSNALPPNANQSEEGNPAAGWVDPHAGFRASMKEIDDKTRL